MDIQIPIFKSEDIPVDEKEIPYQVKFFVPSFTKCHKIKSCGWTGSVYLIRIDGGKYQGESGYIPKEWYWKE